MKKQFLVIIILLCALSVLFASSGCSEEKIKDNQVYVVEENRSQEGKLVQSDLETKGLLPFEEYDYSSEDEEYGQILLTLTSDGKYKYYMETKEKTRDLETIKEDQQLVNIFRTNTETEDIEIIAEGVPFVSQAKWNKDETIVGFCGGDRLTIYDTLNNKLLIEEKLIEDEISYFAWSPKEGNKLYTEKDNLANSGIYYTDLQKKVEPYETKEDIYYKGNLDNRYYYATKWFVIDEEDENKNQNKKNTIKTVVVNDKGFIVKQLGEGRFRDSYEKAVVKIGENGSDLYYIKDINNPKKSKKLTNQYVFDVKFVGDGKIAYLVAGDNTEERKFFLKIVDKNSKLLEKFEVSGKSLALSPNGKIGYIGGPLLEKIDFEEMEIESKASLRDLNKEDQ